MKRVNSSDNDGEINVQLSVSVFSGEFDGSLVSLCSRVAKKSLKQKKREKKNKRRLTMKIGFAAKKVHTSYIAYDFNMLEAFYITGTKSPECNGFMRLTLSANEFLFHKNLFLL